MQRRLSQTLILLCLGLFCVFVLISCTQKETYALDIPAGQASHTLKEFARQAQVEIIFDPQRVDGVQTHSIKGKYDPKSALRHMLKDTPLSVDFDNETGAYAIIRVELSMHSFRIPNTDTDQVGDYVLKDIQNLFMIKNFNFF